MRTITLLFISIGFFILKLNAQSTCNPAMASADLDIANVRAKILNGGDMWWDLIGTAKYEVPKGSGKNSLFSGAIWIGGFDNTGNMHVSAQTYRQSGNDFWPGPIGVDTVCSQFDRIWKLNKSDVDNFIAGGNPVQEIIDYPGTWNSEPLAPFVDMNGDGVYNHLDGDYPAFDNGTAGCGCSALHGDQSLWWVINDDGNIHGVTASPPLHLEIQCQAFAFASTDEDISNTTFYEYKIINRNTTTNIDSTYFGMYVDVDLGYYLDDYVGCDVGRGLAYSYNGDAYDESIEGYGNAPPAIGVDFIFGPAANAGDGIDNDRDGCTDCTFIRDSSGAVTDTISDLALPERFQMSRFISYFNNNDPITGNPNSGEDFYQYLTGLWRNGTKMTYGGNGHGGGFGTTTDPADFMFPGNSDLQNWGTHGIPESPWDETTAGNLPDDRRFLTAAGPFTMLPGAVTCIRTAVIWAQDSAGPLASLNKLKLADDKIQGLNNYCFDVNNAVGSYEKIIPQIFPNPVTNELNIAVNAYLQNASLNIFDAEGNLIHQQNFFGNEMHFFCKQLSPGIYFYQILADKSQSITGKFLKK